MNMSLPCVKEKHGWDGEWYLRAYDYYGRKIGTHKNEEGKIFIESQGWCAMARIGAEKGFPEKALDSAAKLLDSPFGMVLNYPAYTTYHIELGEQSTYPAGYKENGGIFCHNNPWVIIAQTEAGRGNDAWELYRKISPAWIEDQSLHYTRYSAYLPRAYGKPLHTCRPQGIYRHPQMARRRICNHRQKPERQAAPRIPDNTSL